MTTDELIGTVLSDRYRLDQLLGEGGMGRVYAAEHVLMRKRLAVKVLHRELCEVPEVVARFEREAMATANIEHPNIAAATDCGRLADGVLFLVLELVQGKSLRDEVAKGAFALRRALHVARQIASALSAAHALGIVHRDLKPENVMLVTRGSDPDFVKVLDFGIAKVPAGSAAAPLAGPLTKAGVVFGTPEYMSPEQALGQSVDHRTDLYALGAMLYEMVSGVRPFSADTDSGILGQQLAKPVPRFAERAAGVQIPHQVEEVVLRMLAKDVASRYQTADDVVRALDTLMQPTPGADGRIFTLLDGSPTAFLGTAAQVYGATPAQERAPAQVPAQGLPPTEDLPPLELPPPNLPQPPGPSGTLPLLDQGRTEALAKRVAEVRGETAAASWAERWKRLVALTREALRVVFHFIDENRPRLPEKLRHAVRDVPAWALFAVSLMLTWGPLLVVFAWLATAKSEPKPAGGIARSETVSSAQAPATDPVLAELEAAKKEGHAALEKLAKQHPKHGRVLLELAASHAGRGEHSVAVAVVGRALAAEPKLSSEQAATDVLAPAARRPDTSNAAFALLEGPMGASGAEVIYDLSVDYKIQAAIRTRAERVARSPEFFKVATPNVQVASALRYAKSCAIRHELLTKAGEVGDERALAYLKIMRNRSGCGRRGRDDCFPCMRKDDALARAISAIEKRQGS